MKTFELVAPCHFGLEAVLKREIYDLGYEITLVEDGRVTFEGDAEAICRSNIFLRTAERVLLLVGRFKATTFDELFEGIKALPWESYIPVDGKFWVKKASSIKSKLFSSSDIQSIVKKAIVEAVGTIVGAAIMAFGVSSFLLPSQLSSGGVSGIATITYYLLNIPMGVMIMIINIPLFIFAGYRIGKEFFIKSLVGTVSLSLFIDILDKLNLSLIVLISSSS